MIHLQESKIQYISLSCIEQTSPLHYEKKPTEHTYKISHSPFHVFIGLNCNNTYKTKEIYDTITLVA